MDTGIVLLFGLTSFLASALLFSVQPMIGKMVLPGFGGTPAVWNTCLVYFQGTLLCGYLLSYGMRPRSPTKPGRISGPYLLVFAVLLAAGYFLQPIALEREQGRSFSLERMPVLILLGTLSGAATLPLVMVSAIAPLVQGWFSLIGHPQSKDPYFLYSASNAGSLLALLAYPFLIEPNLGGTAQSQLWRTGFLILAALVMACGFMAWRLSRFPVMTCEPVDGGSQPVEAPLTLATRALWIILVFVPVSWLMGVTAYITTDLASIPLMWIIPLALYLLSFILAFSNRAPALCRAAARALPYLIMPVVMVLAVGFVHLLWIPLHLTAFFVGSLTCHSALAQMRPATRHLPFFYITIALGGLLAGIWNSLVAPLVFHRVVEYPLALILASLVTPGVRLYTERPFWKDRMSDIVFGGVVFGLTAILATNQAGLGDSLLGVLGVMIASGMGILACVKARKKPVRFALVLCGIITAGALAPGMSGRLLYIERDFFGVIRVTHDAQRNVNRLFHGSTLHGQQSLDPALRREPSTYFTRSGPIGQVFSAIRERLAPHGTRVAIVGLGAGTLASYAQPGERWTFYEIDAVVERVARDQRFFTYLRDSTAETTAVVLGDARQSLKGAPDRVYSLIVLDAFSSDALPVHLLSREAIRLYREKLAPGGLLLFNLTNRYLDLDPVFGRQAADAGVVCRICHDTQVSDDEKAAGKQPSIWAVMAENATDLGGLASDARWQPPALRPGSAVWTDDYSDLASYLLLSQGRSG